MQGLELHRKGKLVLATRGKTSSDNLSQCKGLFFSQAQKLTLQVDPKSTLIFEPNFFLKIHSGLWKFG